jgi:hypothetical protein
MDALENVVMRPIEIEVSAPGLLVFLHFLMLDGYASVRSHSRSLSISRH